MSVFRNGLYITSDTTGDRLNLARELLESGEACVVLDGRVAMDRRGDRTLCSVITRAPDGTARVFEGEIQAAKQLLYTSSIRQFVREPMDWEVVDDYGNGAVRVWPVP